jgi:streptogramin lyase
VATAVAVTDSAARRAAAPPTDIEQARATRVNVAGDWLAAGDGAIWISDPATGVIRRLDPASGAPRPRFACPRVPCEATDLGFGALWTATCIKRGLARIDAKTNNVKESFARRFPRHSTARPVSAPASAVSGW